MKKLYPLLSVLFLIYWGCEDGQSEKLEEKRINVKKVSKPLFGKDVNDPSERGHD
jgi:hypothetical protein